MTNHFNIPNGLVKLEIFPSGNCIFDAFNYATDICIPVQSLRQMVHDHVINNYDKFKDVLLLHENFFENLKKEYIWDSVEGHVVWVSLSEMFKVNIIILDVSENNIITIGESYEKIIYVEFVKNHYNCYVEEETFQFKNEMLQDQYQDLIAIRNMENDESTKLAKQLEFEESERLARKLQDEENNHIISVKDNPKIEKVDESIHIDQDEIFYYDIKNAHIKDLVHPDFDGMILNEKTENEKLILEIAQSQLNEELDNIKEMMKTFNSKMADLEVIKMETKELKDKINQKVENVAYKYVELEKYRNNIISNMSLC